MSKKIETIDLKGKQYAQVKDRVAAFHEDNKGGSIRTRYEFKEGFAIFTATVVLDIEKGDRYFTGHAFGKLAQPKAFEKLESVAVGRALAMAGYLADGEIASFEEAEGLELAPDFSEHQAKLEAVKSLDELKKVWATLPIEAKNELKVVKEELKAKFAPKKANANA